MRKIRELWAKLQGNTALKEKLYLIVFESDTPAGKLFDIVVMWCIVLSIFLVFIESMQIPIALKPWLIYAEYFFTFIFTVEYLLRLYCSSRPKEYALSFFGIVDLLATLPFYISWIFGPARYLMVVRTFRLIRVFRVFKLFNFLNEGNLLLRSMIISSRKIGVFFLFVVILVVSLGTIMYMVEGQVPDTQFTNIPKSIYWAVVTLTTVGYGDITPTTAVGQFVSSIVMLLGYTIIAVPTGIVSASLIQENRKVTEQEVDEEERENHLLVEEMKAEDREALGGQEILEEPAKSSIHYCPHCGKPIPFEEANFCPYCGTALPRC